VITATVPVDDRPVPIAVLRDGGITGPLRPMAVTDQGPVVWAALRSDVTTTKDTRGWARRWRR
jgi:hypothetical protein